MVAGSGKSGNMSKTWKVVFGVIIIGLMFASYRTGVLTTPAATVDSVVVFDSNDVEEVINHECQLVAKVMRTPSGRNGLSVWFDLNCQ